MAKEKYVRCDLWNKDYTASTEGVLKLLVIMFGGGAWGIVATSAYNFSITGAYSFFMWVAVGTWALSLASYLINLTTHELRRQPDKGDLLMALCFGVLHLIAAIVFMVYTFSYLLWPRAPGITVAVLEWITTLIYIIYGASLVSYYVVANSDDSEPHWIWETLLKPTASTKRSQSEGPQFSDSVVNPPPAVGFGEGDGHTNPAHIEPSFHDEGVIYEDVPIETNVTKYANMSSDAEGEDGKKDELNKRRGSDENAYLSPV